MKASAGDLNHSIVGTGEIGDFGRDADNISIDSVPLNASTRLSMTVRTPCPDLVLIVNGEGMVVAASNILDLLTDAQRGRRYRQVVVAFNGTISELTLWIGAPAVGFALRV